MNDWPQAVDVIIMLLGFISFQLVVQLVYIAVLVTRIGVKK